MDPLRRTLVGITALGLAVDAVVHVQAAHGYDAVGDTLTEGMLFRVEAVVAVISLILLIVRTNRITAGIAAVVAGGGVLALLYTYFVDAGPFGPIPNMYEHHFFAEKTIALVAQTIATVTAIWLVVIGGSDTGDRTDGAAAQPAGLGGATEPAA